MPTKEKTRRTQSKAAFVLGFPTDMPAKEVVARAKEAGLKLNEGNVYVARSTARARAKKRKMGRPAASTRILVSRVSGTEAAFRRIALEIGLGNARALLKDTEQKVAAIIAGR